MDFKPGAPFPREDFFASRILYYPGSGTDGRPIKYFGRAHATHCFVYVDYWVPQKEVFDQLSKRENSKHPEGYRLLESQLLDWCDITNKNEQSYPSTRDPVDFYATHRHEPPFVMWAVMERLDSYDDDHGPMRWSMLHIGHDAFASFDALFCQSGQNPPYAVMLDDANYVNTQFGGKDSLLWKMVNKRSEQPPKWILSGKNTAAWPGYQLVDREGDWHSWGRYLYLLDS